MKEMTIEATVENIPIVTDFVNKELEALDCSIKVQMQINVAIDELFGNIALYAYDPDTSPVRYQGVLKLGLAGGAAPITINVDLNQ